MHPADPDNAVVLAWRRERRAAVRRFHPDRGGSASQLLGALAEVDQKFGLGAAGTSAPGVETEVTVTRSRTYLLRIGLRRLQLLVTSARQHIPRGWPGARRSAQL